MGEQRWRTERQTGERSHRRKPFCSRESSPEYGTDVDQRLPR